MFRGLEGARSRIIMLPIWVTSAVSGSVILFLVIFPLYFLSVLLEVIDDIRGVIGRRSYMDITWLSGMGNMYNR